jgi:hypothetical protein
MGQIALMQSDMERALSRLRDLASLAEMQDLAAGGCGAARQKVNAHVHLPPNFSAFRDVKQAVDQAAEQDVRVLGASNYYDYEVYGDFASLAKSRAIFPLFGLEVICLVDELASSSVKVHDPGNPGKFYLCGKGITKFAAMSPEAQRLLDIIRRNDSTRMAKIVERLVTVFEQRGVKTGLSEAAVIDMVVKRHNCPHRCVYLQERHVCQAFQERFFELVPLGRRIQALTEVLGTRPKAGPQDAVEIQNGIRTHLLKAGKPAYVEETFIGFDDAYRLVTELGGIPCYPTLADGTIPICPFEEPVASLIDRIKQRGIGFAEFIPVRNSPDVLAAYVKTMRAAGLVITAGTEHNTLDLLPMEPTCIRGQPIPEDVQEIFWEGTCVVAAHQFLALHGQQGFAAGASEERIALLARLGAAVIRRYQQGKNR